MACMEHMCVNSECDQELIFNNTIQMDCPTCSTPMKGFFDEEPDYDFDHDFDKGDDWY